jgi:hypothetical protein
MHIYITRAAYLISSIFLLSAHDTLYSMAKTRTRERVETTCFSTQSINYLQTLQLKPEHIAIRNNFLHTSMKSFIHKAALWNLEKVATSNSYNTLLSTQFNITIKYLAPIVADLSNNGQHQQAVTLFHGLEGIYDFCKGACKEIVATGWEELKSAPVSFVANVTLNVAFNTLTSLITIPCKTAMLISNVYNQSGEIHTQGRALFDNITKGNYEDAGAYAARCGMTAFQFKNVFRCFKNFSALVKSKAYRRGIKQSVRYCFTLKKPLYHRITGKPLVNTTKALVYTCPDHNKLVLGNATSHTVEIPGLEPLLLPEKDAVSLSTYLNKKFKGLAVVCPKTLRNHIFGPETKCVNGTLIRHSGWHLDIEGKIEQSKLLNVSVIKQDPKSGLYQIEWCLGGKPKESTMYPKNWDASKATNAIIEAFNDPTKQSFLQDNGNWKIKGKTKDNLLIDLIVQDKTNIVKSVYPAKENIS